MVRFYRCNACGGQFQSPQNGQLYFHTCPPLSVQEVIAESDAGHLNLTQALQADVITAKGPIGPDPAKPTAAMLARDRLALLSVKRAGHVDQNLVDTAQVTPDNPVKPIVAPGAGATEVAPPV